MAHSSLCVCVCVCASAFASVHALVKVSRVCFRAFNRAVGSPMAIFRARESAAVLTMSRQVTDASRDNVRYYAVT